MEKTKAKRKLFLAAPVIAITAALGVTGLLNFRTAQTASAETSANGTVGEPSTQTETFAVSSYETNVNATYEFIPLNGTDCSVRITNKTEATKAVIPQTAEIEGQKYRVTEVTANGFMSCSKLERISLPKSITKVGNMAFANCAKLKRINLADVKELGNSVFYRCPELSELLIPESAESIGTYLLRNNDTQVYVRAQSAPSGWAANWNGNNANQNVEYGSTYVHPLELEGVYENVARSSEPQLVGYNLAGGQPRTDNFYITSENSGDTTISDTDGNIFIPAQYNGVDILGIDDFAFEFVNFNQLVIEYSSSPVYIGSCAFTYAEGNSITINRSVTFDVDGISAATVSSTENLSNNVFTGSSINAIALPDDLTHIPDQAFYECANLENIYFIHPQSYTDRADELNIISGQTENSVEGTADLSCQSLIAIGESAFGGTSSITKLHLYDSITYMGPTVLADWNNSTQTVYVHNDSKITGWNSTWCSTFTNVIYDKVFYTVSFNAGGGTVSPASKDVVYGNAIGELPLPVYGDRTFGGWFCGNTEYTSSTVYTLQSDVELTARWYNTVTFDKNGGTGGSDGVSAEYGKPMPAALAPERTGYRFLGYYKNLNGTDIMFYNGEMQSVKAWDVEINTTLYARWQANTYTVKFNKDGGTGGSDSVTVTYDEAMPAADKPTARSVYEFAGYYTGQNGSGVKYYNADMSSARNWDIADDATLYAYYTEKQFTIAYSLNQSVISVELNPDNPTSITNSQSVTLYSPLGDNYSFTGWYLDGKYVDTLQEIDRDIVLVAHWDLEEISIGSGSGCTTSKKHTVIYFDNIAQNKNYTVYVNGNTNCAEVRGGIRAANISLNIVIQNRSTVFKLVIKNLRITAHSSSNAIVMKSDKMLHLYAYNSTVSGTSSLRLENGNSVSNGSSAIYCKHLMIHTSVTLRGGDITDRTYQGGVAVALAQGGSLTILCNDVSIVGGNAALSPSGRGAYGLAVYAINNDYTISNYSMYTGISITNGSGNIPSSYPTIGY